MQTNTVSSTGKKLNMWCVVWEFLNVDLGRVKVATTSPHLGTGKNRVTNQISTERKISLCLFTRIL